jgi:hypothetical protein
VTRVQHRRSVSIPLALSERINTWLDRVGAK